MRKSLLLLALTAGFSGQAYADFTAKNATSATITFKNSGDCTAVVCVPLFQLGDGTNLAAIQTAGADAVSNTASGLQIYSRLSGYNGTTWDRLQVDASKFLKVTSIIASGGIASGAVASGAYTSGSVASGAFASGALASGSVASGAMVDLGAQADSAAAGDTSTASLIALLKRNNQNLTTLNTTAGLAIPTQSSTVPIGGMSLCDGANGTTNPCTTAATVLAASTAAGSTNKALAVQITPNSPAIAAAGQVAIAAAPPTGATYVGVLGSGATGGHVAAPISCDNHVFKHITSATDTLAVQGVTSQIVYVCAWRARAAGVATWFLENTASTNANCSSSNTQITGVATEAANTGEVFAPGFWTGLKNTVSNGLCINSTGTGGVDIDIWYAQF